MNSLGDDFTTKAKGDLESAITAYLKQADEFEAESKKHLHLAGVAQGKADGLKAQAVLARKQLDSLKSSNH